MKVIPLEKKKRNPGAIRVPLPNGTTFSADENDIRSMFDNPSKFLKDDEREGLLQLAIAVVFAEHKSKMATARGH